MRTTKLPCWSIVLTALAVIGWSSMSRAGGVELNGLLFTISVDKVRFMVGEPVVVRFSWENVGDHVLSLTRWRGPNQGVDQVRHSDAGVLHAFAVYRNSSQRMPYRGVIGWSESSSFNLSPGEVVVRSYDVSWTYRLAEPGSYSLRAAYLTGGLADGQSLLIHPDVVIEVASNE